MPLFSLSTEDLEEVADEMLKEINHLSDCGIAMRLAEKDESQYTPFWSGYEYALERVLIDF